MLTHKDIDIFIRKYNKSIVIKKYSKLKLSQKMALVDQRMKDTKGKGESITYSARMEWKNLKKKRGIEDKDLVNRKNEYLDKLRAAEAEKKSKAVNKPKVKVVAVKKGTSNTNINTKPKAKVLAIKKTGNPKP